MVSTPRPSARPSLVRRALRLCGKLLLSVIVFAALLLALEGAASLYSVGQEFVAEGHAPMAERKHTTYDPLLGWCNVPGSAIEDMYGPGVSIHVNSQGFRGVRDYAQAVPPGKLRLVCTGDSFTLGYGVDDADTWVAVLEELDPRLETVNMGQGGYGVDQAFLWYRRDAGVVDHDVHLFAFITGDFARAQKPQNYGYPKPFLRVVDGELVTENVPVWRLPYRFPRIAQNQHIFGKLRAVELATELTGKKQVRTAMSLDELRAMVLVMFDELKRTHDERGSLLVAVHLPMKKAFKEPAEDDWEGLLARELPARGIPYLNLLNELRAFPAEQVHTLFIKPGEIDYPGAEGHFTARGNRWAAEAVHRLLLEIDAVAERLGEL